MSFEYNVYNFSSTNGDGIYYQTHRRTQNSQEYCTPNRRPTAHAKRQLQDPTIHHDLKVSLEDIYKGCIKNMRVTRFVECILKTR